MGWPPSPPRRRQSGAAGAVADAAGLGTGWVTAQPDTAASAMPKPATMPAGLALFLIRSVVLGTECFVISVAPGAGEFASFAEKCVGEVIDLDFDGDALRLP